MLVDQLCQINFSKFSPSPSITTSSSTVVAIEGILPSAILIFIVLNPWPKGKTTRLPPLNTRLRMTFLAPIPCFYRLRLACEAYFDQHHFSVPANHNAGFRTYCSHCMLSGWRLHTRSKVSVLISVLFNCQSQPGWSLACADSLDCKLVFLKIDTRMVYSYTSIQGLKYSTVLM